jgi:spermidine synthase
MPVKSHSFYIIVFLTSFASMAFEILVARMISTYSHNYVLAQSLTISIFILGMGCGSYLFKFLKNRTINSLIKIELSLFVIAFFSVFIIQTLTVYMSRVDWAHEQKLFTLLVGPQFFVFAVALLAGIEIPFFEYLFKEKGSENKFGLILALSYFGSFAASYLTVSWLLPYIGLFSTFNCVFLIVLMAGYLLCLHTERSRNLFLAIILMLSSLTAFNFYFAKDLQQIYLKNYYYGHSLNKSFWQMSEFPFIERHSTAYQEIDIVPDLFTHTRLHDYYLYIDQKLQYASRNEAVYHESMVHGAINLSRQEPRNVLVLGGGEGLIARELLKYNSIQKIDLIELDQAVLTISRTNPLFVNQNKNSLADPRVHIHVGDAYMWLKNTAETYDAIFIDLPHPFSVELSRLYSFEFYSFAKKRLRPEGFIVFDYPLNHLLNLQLKYYPAVSPHLIYNTLMKAGFKSHFSFGPKESFIFASQQSKKFSFDEEPLFPLVQNITLSNLTEIDEGAAGTSETPANSVFKPYFLTE